jgi:hypothetical protein
MTTIVRFGGNLASTSILRLSLLGSWVLVWVTGACTIKHHGPVMYGKWTDLVVSYNIFIVQSHGLASLLNNGTHEEEKSLIKLIPDWIDGNDDLIHLLITL